MAEDIGGGIEGSKYALEVLQQLGQQVPEGDQLRFGIVELRPVSGIYAPNKADAYCGAVMPFYMRPGFFELPSCFYSAIPTDYIVIAYSSEAALFVH